MMAGQLVYVFQKVLKIMISSIANSATVACPRART